MTAKEETRPLLDATTKSADSSSVERTQSCQACVPRSEIHRYIILVLLCTVGLGDYFCTNSPAALQSHFLEDLHISETRYMSFYSNMQWTGIVSCLFGGFLIDRIFGNRLGIILFSILVACTHALFAVGALLNSYWLMFVARGIYGIVDGPMNVANDNMAVKWFKTSINMVMGLKTSIARFSSVVALNVLGSVYDYFSHFFHGHICLGVTLFSGAVIAVLSFLAATALGRFDRKADKNEKGFTGEQVKNEDIVHLSDVKDFPASFWLISWTTTVYYMAVFPFVGLGEVYFEMKYEKDPGIADNVNSMVYLMAAITMPIFGVLIDRVGRSLTWMFIGILLSVTSHIILAFTFVEPYVATVTLGLGYSIVTAAMWPMASYVVAFNHLGTAYGIMNALVLTGQAVAAYFAGYLADTTGYLILEVFFIASMAGAFILGSLLYIIDQSKGAFILGSLLYIIDQSKDGVLNLGSKERAKRSPLLKSTLIQEVNVSQSTGTSAENAT